MSAQERDELMELCWKAIGGRSLHAAPQPDKDDMAATADALLAAGWSRPVAAGGEVEAADLLAGGVPGRSEAEIKAEALKIGDVADVTLTLEIGDEEEDWIAVGPAGDAWPDVDGWWIPRAMIHRATDPLAARVAGTTEAGDES